MKLVRLALLCAVGASLSIGGCPAADSGQNGPGSVSAVSRGLVPPGVLSAPVRVRVFAPETAGVSVRVTMRVVGQVVHFSTREVAAGKATLIIGPDRADTVIVEGTILTDPPQVAPIHSFVLGRDFKGGELIVVTYKLDTGEGQPPPPPPPAPPPPPPPADLTVALLGLDQNVKVKAGTKIAATAHVENFDQGAVLRVLADPDATPASGNEIKVVEAVVGASLTAVTWDTAGVAPGSYALYAEVQTGAAIVRSAASAGRVTINAPPTLVFGSPIDGQLIGYRSDLIIGWVGQDADDDAKITIFLDSDTALNGNEIILASGISEDDINNRELTIPSADLPKGTFQVGGVIDDSFEQQAVYAGKVCTTARLAGRAHPQDLLEGEATTIRGDLSGSQFGVVNVELGASVAANSDFDNDGRADILLGDPTAAWLSGKGALTGAAYVGLSPSPWPREVITSSLTTALLVPEEGALTGRSVAAFEHLGGDTYGRFAIGAPGVDTEIGDEGAAFVADSELILDPCTPILLTPQAAPPILSVLLGDDGLFGAERVGESLAAVGNVNGDALADLAVGIPGYESETGRVAIISAKSDFGSKIISQIGSALAGVVLLGETPGDLAGSAIAGVRDLACAAQNCRGPDEVLIGAPGANFGAGRVYLVLGDPSLLQAPEPIGLSQVGTQLPGLVFLGESAGDGAGSALAGADFNGDGKHDLLIGAPLHDGGRGRVYVIFNSAELLAALNGPPIPLAAVGSALPGVVFDGVAPADLLGASLARAGDVDLDGADDILLGAPGTESLRGSTFLVYGTPSLNGTISLALAGTCDLQSWQLVGDVPGNRLGAALSGGGDMNGDGRADFAVGAPGDAVAGGAVRGEAHLVFGPLIPQ